jgi:hypothetical protein
MGVLARGCTRDQKGKVINYRSRGKEQRAAGKKGGGGGERMVSIPRCEQTSVRHKVLHVKQGAYLRGRVAAGLGAPD